MRALTKEQTLARNEIRADKIGLYAKDMRKFRRWERNIIRLCKDFLVDQEACEYILQEVDEQYGTETDSVKYDKAQRMVMNWI